MKIAIVWAHGVWKTTLSKELWNKLDIHLIEDIVPMAHNLGFTINEDTPIETQFWLTAKQMELERSYENFIADKCLIDYYVYGKVLIDDKDLINSIEKISERNSKYDYIFYIPIEFDLVDDWLRPMDPEFQKKIDQEYKKFIDEKWLEYTTITGSVEERIEKIMNIINQ